MKDNFSGPIVFWAWNSDMKTEEMESQLKDFGEKGISGVFIHARMGLEIEYMGEKWFQAFDDVLKICEKIGLDVWIYDENGWPSGFGGGKVYSKCDEFKEKYLLSKYVTKGEFLGQIKDRETLIAVYSFDGSSFTQEKFEELDGDRRYYFIYQCYNDYYVDVLNKDAIDYFIQVTHEVYKEHFKDYFGNVIKGIFTDEPHSSPRGLPWGKYVPINFEKMYGKSVYEALPYMFYELGSYREYRYQYWKCVNCLMAENYAGTYADWCDDNNLIFTGHYACEESLVYQVDVCGGVMPLYERMGIIGVDALGNRLVPPAVFKQAESVSWQIGNRRVLCETFAGSGYDATASDLLWIWSYQASMGVNVPCLSISMYSLIGGRKRDYPQYFSYQMPWWEESSALFGAMRNINETMTVGDRGAGVLLIHPLSSTWCETGIYNRGESLMISSEFRMLTESLNDLQVDFDYGDEYIMGKYGTVEGGSIRIGNRRYDMVIIPPMVNIEKSTADLLKEFAAAGGKVFVTNCYPKYLNGKAANDILGFDTIFTVNRKDLWRKALRLHYPRDIEIIEKYTRNTCYGFTAARRYAGDKVNMLVVNASRSDKKEARIRTTGKKQITKVSIAGERELLYSSYNEKEDCTYTPIEMQPQEACFFVAESCRENGKRLELIQKTALCGFDIQYGCNVFTIDRLSYKIEGREESPVDYAIHQTERLYTEFEQVDGDADTQLNYFLNVREVPQGKVFAVCEALGGEVSVNGHPARPDGWWLDKGMGRFDISGFLQTGVNRITIKKRIPKFNNPYKGKDVFQSITNVFSYPYNLESVYILGDFDVVCERTWQGDNCIWANGSFAIAKPTKKRDISDLTSQGMWFFCGDVTAEKELEIKMSGGRAYFLEYSKPDAFCAVVQINGKAALAGIPPYRIDITGFIKDGTNKISIKLFSTARNLLGPHHHVYGKHYYTGPSVFEGVQEWQDFVVYPELTGKTWVNEYSFIEFGLKDLFISEYEVKDGND